MISKIFKAYDVRAIYPDPLGTDDAWKVGHAAATFLQRSAAQFGPPVGNPDRMVVGRDMRPSSPDLADALIDGIRATGMHVIDVGMIDTSCIYFAVNHYDAVGGIQTTASHNPVQYNGFKISGPRAKPVGSQTGLKDIERLAQQLSRRGETGSKGDLTRDNIWPAYRAHVLGFLDLKRPVQVACDASNGMAGVMVPNIFDGVENLHIDPINYEVGVAFVHDPNPLVEANLAQVKHAVRNPESDGRYDAGVCFDGDADRCIFVDETGTTVGCDVLSAVLARDFLRQPGNAGNGIVYDLRSTHALREEIEAAGGKPLRERVGHVFMKKALADSGGVFGGELSGHFYFRDNFNADSGAIAFARVLSILSASDEPLSAMVKPLLRYSQSGELNFHVEDKDGMIRQIADRYKQHQIDYLDGITVDAGTGGGDGGGWWFNVRKSNTEPMLRLNLEARDAATLSDELAKLKAMLGDPVEGH